MADCESTIVKCANCKGDHVASSRHCRYNQEAIAIEKKRREGMSFERARKFVTEGPTRANRILEERGIPPIQSTRREKETHSEHSLNQIEVIADVHNSQGTTTDEHQKSYAHAVKSNKQIELDFPDIIQRHMDKIMTNITKKMLSFLQEVFSLHLQKENTRERKLVLLNLTKHHFGIEYAESDPRVVLNLIYLT